MTKTDFLKRIKPDSKNPDPDNADQTRQFYVKFWANLFPNEDDNKNAYRGETIISFNTVAGGAIRLYGETPELGMPSEDQSRLLIILNSNRISWEMKEKFLTFHNLYNSLSNFMPLPWEINQMKSRAPYHDFFDAFFDTIKNRMQSKDSEFSLDVYEKYQDTYFDKFSGWNDFVEKNYLQDFFEDNEPEKYEDFKQLASRNKTYQFPFQESNHSNLQEYFSCNEEYIYTFLDTSIEIIRLRGKRLEEKNREINY